MCFNSFDTILSFFYIYDLFLQVEFWIDLMLTILGYIPGIIYAIYVLVA